MIQPLRVLLVGPLPPPSGGMANQTRQLKRLLESEGVQVSLVQTNAPYRPAWIANLRGVRAVLRFIPYVGSLAREAKNADVVHVMANSGWSWHLLAAPAAWIARMRGTPVVINYRGGLAAEFLDSHEAIVQRTLAHVAALVVPSRFLRHVFEQHGIQAAIIPNIVDVATFQPAADRERHGHKAPHIVVARNLEHLYGNDVAIRAFAAVQQRLPQASLSIAGSGPELEALRYLARQLGIEAAVRFTGRLETAEMVRLYQSADLVLNPSRADNAPNSVLEALACGVPVVSTDVGGVPFLVEHGRTAWLVPPDAAEKTAEGIFNVLSNDTLRRNLIANGHALADSCAWSVVRGQWLDLYHSLLPSRGTQRNVISTG